MINVLCACIMAAFFMWESNAQRRPFWLWVTAILSAFNSLAVIYPTP
jgi:hypothetical protein